MADPVVSVVLSTCNRIGQLPAAVEACLGQDGGDAFELIVVDNNSTDGTRQWIEQRMARGDTRLRYVFEPHQGLPFARNAGIARARGSIIAFTDDDVTVARDWIAATVRAFERHPDVDMVGGKVLPRWPAHVPGWFSRLQWAPLALQDKGDLPVRIDAGNAAPCLIGASMAFRRSVFEKIGRFDVTFTRAQDREIQMRLWRSGGRGLYDPAIVAWVDVPAERLTREYFRFWYTRSGGLASRMRLLDQLDREGRLADPTSGRGRSLLGCPGHLYRALLQHLAGWIHARFRRDEAVAFYHENRVRYHLAYIRARVAEQRTGTATSTTTATRPISGEL